MPRLGQLEAVVMGRLWAYGRAVPVRQVLEDLRRERTIAYTTVMTVMDNLHRKGLLVRQMEGRAYVYRPTSTREQYTADVMSEVLADSEDLAGVLLHFFRSMPAEDARRLRDALDDRTGQGGPDR